MAATSPARMISVFGGYAFNDNLSIELTLNHILGEFSDGYSATLGLMHVFVPEWRISPYFTLGTGVIYTEPKARSWHRRPQRSDRLRRRRSAVLSDPPLHVAREYPEQRGLHEPRRERGSGRMEESGLRLLFLIAVVAAALPGCAMQRNGGGAPARRDAGGRAGGRRAADRRSSIRRSSAARSSAPASTPRTSRSARTSACSASRTSRATSCTARASPITSPKTSSSKPPRPVARGPHSFENLSGSADLLTDDERDYTYYALSFGWNALPGEIFIGENRAYNTAFYLVAGIGSTTFAGDDRFTVNGGFGYRILPADWIAVHFDVRDHVFDIDLLGEKKIVNNLEAHLGLSIFF